MKRANLIISVLIIIALFVLAEIAQASWIYSYKSDSGVFGHSVMRTSDSGYLISGEFPNIDPQQGALLLKLDDSGNFQWAKRYGDFNTYKFYTVLETSSQEYIAAGMLTHMNIESNGLIIKTDLSGKKLWEKEYPGISSIQDMKRTSDGGYICGGYYLTGHPDPQYYIALKLDSNLIPVWRTGILIYSRYGKKYPIHETMDGGFILADGVRVIKLNPDGSIKWQKKYDDNELLTEINHLFSVSPTSDGNFIVCGSWMQTINGLADGAYFVLKIDNLGNPLWAKAYEENDDGGGEQWALSAIESENGDIIVGGENSYNRVISLFRLDSNGNIKWQKEYGAYPDITKLLGLVSEIDGNVFTIGYRTPDRYVNIWERNLLLMNLNPSGGIGDDCNFIKDSLLESINISVTAQDTTVSPDGTLYTPIDLSIPIPVYETTLEATIICEGLPTTTPTIAQLPMSGPPGTIFTQWGDGFTPNTTGKLWTRNPDGSELYIQDVPMDETGHFEITYESRLDKVPGTYVWWVVDGGVGEIKSNEVSYEITEPLPVQVTLTLNIDPQTTGRVTIKPSGDVCETGCSYNFESGTQLELLSDANASWKFECWSDGTSCISSDNPFVTTIETDKTLTAVFKEAQVKQIPVLIIPGITGSWSEELLCNNRPLIEAAERRLDIDIPTEWSVVLNAYDTLKNAILASEFIPVEVPYDWRKEIPDIVDDFLIPAIDRAKQKYGVDKIHIVAHSMGGLIARYYIQNNIYRSDVSKLVMIGTPQQGSVDSYFMWEGGDYEPKIAAYLPLSHLSRRLERVKRRLYMEVVLDAMKTACGNFNSDVQFIRETIPSVKQLMPTFPYIQRNRLFNFNPEYVPIEEMCIQNDFLVELNESIENLLNKNIDIKIIVSSSESSLRGIKTTRRFSCEDEKWPDGSPLDRIYSTGDARVLYKESGFPYEDIPEFLSISYQVTSGEHTELPNLNNVTRSVVEFLEN